MVKSSLNPQKLKQFLQTSRSENRYKDIEAELDWSPATVSKYVKNSKKLGLTEKFITEDDHPGYRLTDKGATILRAIKSMEPAGKEQFTDFESLKFTPKIIDHWWQLMEKYGLFDEGMDEEEIEDYLSTMIESLNEGAKKIGDDEILFEYSNEHEGLNLQQAKLFLDLIFETLPEEAHEDKIELSIKIDSDLDKFRFDEDHLDEFIEDLRES